MAESLYRKYRPQVFEDVVGQGHIERTLKNAIDQDKVSHAYLFCGPRGTGKTTMARLLAKALLCEHGPTSEPCGTCRACTDIANGVHPDVYELDAASRTGVENVREEIISRVNFAPTRGSKKIYIIDEVHMLSTAAFNALLKTLEEPPAHVVFILCTTDPQKVPETIHSRCQRFDFHRLSTDQIVARLGAVCEAEGVEFEGEALELVAHRADGGMRNALTSLEQLIAFGGGTVTVKGAEDLLGSLDSSDMAEIIAAVGKRDAQACFTWVAHYVEAGSDLAQFARDMAEHVRDLYVLSLAGTDAALDVTEAERREMAGELPLFGPDRLSRLLGVLGDLLSELRTSSNARLDFEIALTRMIRPESDLTLESLAERIEALEKGQAARPAAPAAAVAAAAPVAAAAAPSPQAAPAPRPSAPAQAARAAAPAQAAAAPTAARPAAPAGAARSAREMAQAALANSRRSRQQAPAPAPAPARPQRLDPYEAPAPQPAAPAPDPASGLAALVDNPAALQRAWRSTVTAVKREKAAYGVLLVNVRVRPNDAHAGIVIEFPPDNPFAFKMSQRPEVQQSIGRALETSFGMHVPFACVQAGQAPAGAPTAAGAPASPVAPQPAAASAQPSVPSGAQAALAKIKAMKAAQAAQSKASAGSAPHAAPVPRPQAAPRPSAPQPAAPAFADDAVPLDAYEGYADAYAEEDDGWQPPEAPAPARSAAPAPQPSAAPAAQPAPSAPNGDAPTPEAEAAQLGKMLSDAIGEPVAFKQVDD
ncbi:MAG: DNA polymerase III subunit gamma/tau [Denitrobacterium sp.]|jgi:DNA polymerase-3 subunit gamma/tau|nr:DNA polymerase III subunit gamma/tau [Denitrobacterium sp.]